MQIVSRCGVFYLERQGIVETRHAPSPMIDMARNLIHNTPFTDPALPHRLRGAENGTPTSPDHGVTKPW